MWLRLRQICLVAREMKPVREDLTTIFGIEVCHVDPNVGKYGLENILMPVGRNFLEVVAPVEPGTAAGRYLDRRGGDGGYMVITQCDDHAPRRSRIEALGVRVANALSFEDFDGMQLHPKDTGGAFFEIDHAVGGDDPDGPWHPAGSNWKPHRRTDVVDGIKAAELQSDDPERLARRWGEIAEIPVTRNPEGGFEIALQNATLRFVEAMDGRGEGLGGLDISVVDRDRLLANAGARGCTVADELVLVCGTRFRLV